MRLKTLEISVGAFMLVGSLGLVFLALKVSGLSLSQTATESYVVYAHFENVAGLKERAKVTLSGVTVGRVSRIDYDTERFDAVVEMTIDSHYDQLPTDTSASILTSGLLGEKYIGFSVGADDEFLVEGGVIDNTQSSLVLEELIGRFLFNAVND